MHKHDRAAGRPKQRRAAGRSVRRTAALLVALAICCHALLCAAAPEAKILRIDPRASQESGAPLLTTVIEIAQSKRINEATSDCATMSGNAQYDCMSAAIEKEGALYSTFPFPKDNAIFTVTVDGADQPAKFVSDAGWGESQQQPGVGTAWLILIDADKRMGAAFADAKTLASRFIAKMGPNDIVDVIFFNDIDKVKESNWIAASDKARASAFVAAVTDVYPSHGRDRRLLTIIKNSATSGFKALGNVGETVKVPLHQAMVVLSTGFGGSDPSTTGPGAMELSKYLTGGRFPEDNTALPKAPVPVISVYLPTATYEEFRQNSMDFMQNLADTSIGGFFTIMPAGRADHSEAIVSAVRTRFSKMRIVRWRVACIAPSVTQTFKLVFNNVKPMILGDNTFKDVPVGIDPSTWPLDVNVQYTVDMVKKEGVYPGGSFKVYGDFCWGGDKSRAEVYFLPAGQAAPAGLAGADIEKAKQTQQQLIAMGMKGTPEEASSTYVQFKAPDKDKILHGSGDSAVVRLIVYDSSAHRTSGVTADSILTLRGTQTPFPLLPVLGGAFGGVVVILLLVTVFRGGNKRRGTPPPAPVVAGAPGGYPAPQPYPPQPYAPPAPAYAPPAPAYAPPPAAPGQDFMYGGQPPQYGLTGAEPAHRPAPPNPYAAPPANVTRGTLQGSAGTYTVMPGVELRAGRDGAQCGILLNEPRVSGVHASLKLEAGQLLLRDEHSNNGTLLNGSRLTPGAWTPVPNGSVIRFGPVEFSVRLE